MANRETTPELGEPWHGLVCDEPFAYPVTETVDRFDGAVWSIRSDTVEFDDQSAVRDVLIHPGAVAIVALNDQDEVLLIRQYRHPVAAYLFETPAGLLDKPSEDPLEAAKRELIEEAGLEAKNWGVLLDVANSPGGSSEIIRFYLARDISAASEGRVMTGEAEEASLPSVWVDLDEALQLVLAGQLISPNAVVGVFAAHAARASDWDDVRPADAPWNSRANLLDHNLVAEVKR
ncbi:MAG: NUDIX hydrolase [Candidatus Nanopelagicales bacterium]